MPMNRPTTAARNNLTGRARALSNPGASRRSASATAALNKQKAAKKKKAASSMSRRYV